MPCWKVAKGLSDPVVVRYFPQVDTQEDQSGPQHVGFNLQVLPNDSKLIVIRIPIGRRPRG